MRIQALENNIFIKSLDNVDSHLVNIISRYFNDDANYIRTNAESIIDEAIRRVKEDLNDSIKTPSIGNSVTSVNKMTGDVILDYSNVGAEKEFAKKTAFNKNFGTTNGTVCEGDDIRLSDSRTPLEHYHDEYLSPLELDLTILSLLSKNGITINGTDVIISNKNLKIVNGELVENNG